MPHYGVFIDPSGYRHNNLNFNGGRLRAFADVAQKDWLTYLQTDISVQETKKRIKEDIRTASGVFARSDASVFKSVDDPRLNVFRTPPDIDELVATLTTQFEDHLHYGQCEVLSVADIDPSTVFDDYFAQVPPFDVVADQKRKKKHEFPDAFTLKRLVMWAEAHDTLVYVVANDPDLERVCAVQDPLLFFQKIEALLDHLHRADALVQQLHQRPQSLVQKLTQFIQDDFADRTFVPLYNDHGEVENVEVEQVSIGDVYALEVGDGVVKAEAEAEVRFVADVSYDDLDTGFYDKEAGRHYMTEFVSLEVQDTVTVNVLFDFSVSGDDGDEPIVSSPSIIEDTISVQEEDRGDYGMYK
tara:strand:+ start:10174 stop:11241 length:1068 start_codon:yes stop_codon:yes gene_type:complete